MLTSATRASSVWLPLLRGSSCAESILHSQCAAVGNEAAVRSECSSPGCSGCSVARSLSSSSHTWPIGALLMPHSGLAPCYIVSQSDQGLTQSSPPGRPQHCLSQLQQLLAPLTSQGSLARRMIIGTGFTSRQYSSYNGGNDGTRGSSQRESPGRHDRGQQPGQQKNPYTPSPPRFAPNPAPVHPTPRSTIHSTPTPLTNAMLLQITTFEQMRHTLSFSLALSPLPQLLQAMSRLVYIHRQEGMYEALPLAQHIAESITLRLLPHLHTLSSSSTTELLWCMAHLGLPNLGNTYALPKNATTTNNPSNRHRSTQPAPASALGGDGSGLLQAVAESVCPLQSGLLARLHVLGLGEFSSQDASRVVWAAAKLQQRQRKAPLKWQVTPGAAPGLGDTRWWDNLATAMLPAHANPTHPVQEGGSSLEVEDWADVVWAFALVAYKGPVRGRLCSAAADALLQRRTCGEEGQQPVDRESEGSGAMQQGWGGGSSPGQQRGGVKGAVQQGTGLGDGFFLNASSGRIASLLHSLALLEQYHPDVMQRGVEALLEHGAAVRAKDWSNVLWACATLHHSHPDLFRAALGHLVAPGMVLKPAEIPTLLWSCAKMGTERQLVSNFLVEYMIAQQTHIGGHTHRGQFAGNSDTTGRSKSGSSSSAQEHSVFSRYSVNAAANTMWAIAELGMLGPEDGVVLDNVFRPLLALVHSSFPEPQSPSLQSPGTPLQTTLNTACSTDSNPQRAHSTPHDLYAKNKLALLQLAQVHYALRNAGASADLCLRPDLIERGTAIAIEERRIRKLSRDHHASPVQTAASFLKTAVGTRGLVSVQQDVLVLDGLVAAGLVVCLQQQGQGVRHLAVEVDGGMRTGRNHQGRRQGTTGLQLSLLQHAFGIENVVAVGTEDLDWLTLDAEAGAKHLLDVLGADD